LALLERRAIPLLRTDPDGTVTIVGDGSRWWLPRHPEIVRGSPVGAERGGVGGAQKKQWRESENPSRLINVNTTSQEELETLL